MDLQGLVCLSALGNQMFQSERTWSLADLTTQVLKKPLPKGAVRTSDWDGTLSAEQRQYAATDAWLGFELHAQIHRRLQSGGEHCIDESLLAPRRTRTSTSGCQSNQATALEVPGPSKRQVHALFVQGRSLEQVQQSTGLALSTVTGYLTHCLQYDAVPWDWTRLEIPDSHAINVCMTLGIEGSNWPWLKDHTATCDLSAEEAVAALGRIEQTKLKELKDKCMDEVTYNEIRFLLLFVKITFECVASSN